MHTGNKLQNVCGIDARQAIAVDGVRVFGKPLGYYIQHSIWPSKLKFTYRLGYPSMFCPWVQHTIFLTLLNEIEK